VFRFQRSLCRDAVRRTLISVVLLFGPVSPAMAATGDAPVLRAANAETIPYRRAEEGADGAMLLRVIAGLGAVLLVGAGAIYVLKKYLPGAYGIGASGPQRIRLLEVRRMTPRLTLFAVEFEGKHFLLAQSGDRVTTVFENAVDTGGKGGVQSESPHG
jgi:hypothetical protein